jgi:F420-0:gamma-glutamyl ligase
LRVQEQGTVDNYKAANGLCTGKKDRSVPVTLARKKQRSICFFLDLFVSFWGNAKKKIKRKWYRKTLH